MFTWICPQCGSEVPPSYSECPTCAERQAAQQAKAGAPAAAVPPPHAAPTSTYAPAPPQQAQAPHYPPQQPYYPPQQAYPPQPQPQYAPPPPGYAPPHYGHEKPGPPAWLVTVGVAVALIAAFALLYKFVLAPKNSAKSAVAFETPEGKNSVPTKDGAAVGNSVHLAKVVEITGIRIFEEKRKPMVRFMVINHSQAPLDGITGTVTLRAQGKDEPIATIPVKVDSVAAFEGKDITAPLKTSMRAYELPDWQFIKIETQLESQ